MDTPAHRPATSVTVLHGLLGLGVGAIVGFGYVIGDVVSAALLLLALLLAYRGYWVGMIAIAASLLGLLAAFRFAGPMGPGAIRLAEPFVTIPDAFRPLAGIVLAGILTASLVTLAVRLAGRLMLRVVPHGSLLNQWVGAGLGGIQGVAVATLLILGVQLLAPQARQTIQQPQTAPTEKWIEGLCHYIVAASEATEESSLGAMIACLAPSGEQFELHVHEMAQTITSHQPDSFHAALVKMAQGIRHDPQALQDLSEKVGVDAETLQRVMDSPQFSEALNNLEAPRTGS